MNTRLNEFRVSNDAVDDAEELRRRMDEEGYIFIKKLQDPDKLLALRQDIESLDTLLKIVNIWAVPLLVAIMAIIMALYRRRRYNLQVPQG